jgi:hypothetical protein
MQVILETRIRHLGEWVLTAYRELVAPLTRWYRYRPDLPLMILVVAILVDGRNAFADMVTGTCPSGHVRQVILGSTSLYIEGQWPVTLFTHVPLANKCSSQPVLGDVLNFRDLNDALAQELNKRSVRFDEFRLYWSTSKTPQDVSFIPSAPDKRLVLPAGIIEEITKEFLRGAPEDPNAGGPLAPLDRRFCRLQHRTANGSLGEPFMIHCGNLGLPSTSSRVCHTRYRYGADVVVLYDFRPDDLTSPQEHYGVAGDPIPEPDGFLAFDARLRAWIADMQKRPE